MWPCVLWLINDRQMYVDIECCFIEFFLLDPILCFKSILSFGGGIDLMFQDHILNCGCVVAFGTNTVVAT